METKRTCTRNIYYTSSFSYNDGVIFQNNLSINEILNPLFHSFYVLRIANYIISTLLLNQRSVKYIHTQDRQFIYIIYFNNATIRE